MPGCAEVILLRPLLRLCSYSLCRGGAASALVWDKQEFTVLTGKGTLVSVDVATGAHVSTASLCSSSSSSSSAQPSLVLPPASGSEHKYEDEEGSEGGPSTAMSCPASLGYLPFVF
jgi:hypothetical protein